MRRVRAITNSISRRRRNGPRTASTGTGDGMHAATEIEPPLIVLQSAPDRYTLRAALSLPDRQRDRTLRLGLAAVLEEETATFPFGRWRVRPVRRIFITPMGFALELSKG